MTKIETRNQWRLLSNRISEFSRVVEEMEAVASDLQTVAYDIEEKFNISNCENELLRLQDEFNLLMKENPWASNPTQEAKLIVGEIKNLVKSIEKGWKKQKNSSARLKWTRQ